MYGKEPFYLPEDCFLSPERLSVWQEKKAYSYAVFKASAAIFQSRRQPGIKS